MLQPASRKPKAVKVESIARRLPSMLPSAARATRVGFDRRFQRWLVQAAGLEGARVEPGRAPTELLSLGISCAQGHADVALDPAQWPALQMAVGLTDANLSRDVTEALLSPLLRRLAALLPGARIGAVRRYRADSVSTCSLPSVSLPHGAVSLVRVDSKLAAHIDGVLGDTVAAHLSSLAAMRVPTRLMLFERSIRRQRLQSLAVGDVVLCGAGCRMGARWRATLKFGLGLTMQAHADLDLNLSRAHLAAPPRAVNERSGQPDMDLDRAPAGLENMQVPVAFEIDSALVSLRELASLGEGSVIELDVALLEAPVRLVCHGQTLGMGQLVAIGDQLGVRVLRMGESVRASAGGKRP